jgi:hypothetical protein
MDGPETGVLQVLHSDASRRGLEPAFTKVDVSMISLKWGDFLSMLLPGVVALFSLKYWIPALREEASHLEKVTAFEGAACLIAAALLGGVLEALTRVTWEKYWLVKRCKPPAMWHKLKDPLSLSLYENGVQGSYKYATFYSNFGFAAIFLLVSRCHAGVRLYSFTTVALLSLIGLLFWASDVQWGYFVKYQKAVFGEDKKDAQECTAPRDRSKISSGSEEGKSE